MTKFVPVDRKFHAEKTWRRPATYGFAAKDALAPAIGIEIGQLAGWMPIAFTQHHGKYTLVAVMSPIPNRNLFIAPDGTWMGGYIPAIYRGYPFRLIRAQGAEQRVLCIDEDSGLIGDADAAGEPFVDEHGPTKAVTAIADFLQQVQASRMATELAVSSLAEAGVIEKWPLRVQLKGAEKPVEGLYRINEKALNSLADDAFIKLRKSGALPLAYAQLLSMGQTVRFEHLLRAHGRLAQAPKFNPEELFKSEPSDIIRFD